MKKLGDLIVDLTEQETSTHFFKISDQFTRVATWIKENVERTEKSIALFNLLTTSISFLKIDAENIDGHISIQALITRNLYELNLQTRRILSSADGLKEWQAELATDRIQVLEGILELETVAEMEPQRAILQSEIDRITSLRNKHGLPDIKPLSAGNIAKSVGLSKEHAALFKLFSKLVHPSSYLVNSYADAASLNVRVILQIHAQLYAWDLYTRICDEISVPKSIYERGEATA